MKCVLSFSLHLLSEAFIFYQEFSEMLSQMYRCLRVKCRHSYQTLITINFSRGFQKMLKTRLQNPPGRCQSLHSEGRTDRHMTKLISPFLAVLRTRLKTFHYLCSSQYSVSKLLVIHLTVCISCTCMQALLVFFFFFLYVVTTSKGKVT